MCLTLYAKKPLRPRKLEFIGNETVRSIVSRLQVISFLCEAEEDEEDDTTSFWTRTPDHTISKIFLLLPTKESKSIQMNEIRI